MTREANATLINMTRPLLKAKEQSGSAIDLAMINETLKIVAPLVAATSGQAFTDDDFAEAARALETAFVTEQGPALGLRDTRRPPDWYVGERRRPGPFLDRYLQKLEEDGWPIKSVNELRESTARVLESLDDPTRPGPWDWRGLVVGDVQSGKTAHYAGVINRAADAGYRLIVVMAGMHNVLRLQTQLRMDADFLGFDTNPKNSGAQGQRIAIGVGTLNHQLIVDSLTTAVPNGDFSIDKVSTNFAPLSQPFLLVVKKNASILHNLNRWIKRLPDVVRGAPLLVIDDEADQASIDTKDQPLLPDGTFDEDYNPTRINGEIRKLLKSFSRSAYVGYTATPFANILMHDEKEAKLYGADLFPATFIISLTPPDDYFGPSAVFGTNDEGDAGGLPLVLPIDQTAEGWIPDVHDKTLRPWYDGEDRIPPSLEKAIDCFLLSCAARAARGQDKVHNSMLVHVSRFVDVHDVVHAQVLHYLDKTRAFISGGDRATLERLHRLWEEEFVPKTLALMPTVFGRRIAPIAWTAVKAKLSDTADKIRVAVTNGRSKVGLDYDAYKDGLSIIAIGGDKLSRGLTLEGLTVSYFLRISKQYDSLLQMGRWFGYRRGFADLCRLFTTSDMEDWFRHVATANKELREQLAHMQLILATPREYGLRVAGHSDMNVTAENKQRYASQRQVGFAGEGKIQTVMFRDAEHVDQNSATTDNFLESLGKGKVNPTRPGKGPIAQGILWRGVAGRAVSEFLRAFVFPPENLDLDSNRLATYIDAQMAMSELTEWAVFLPTGDQSEITLGGNKIRAVERNARKDRASEPRFVVRSILNPPDEAIDLSNAEFAQALDMTNQARKAKGDAETDRPSGPSLRAIRGRRPENSLLLIYPIDPAIAKAQSKNPVIGLVVSFPDSTKALNRLYVENRVVRREREG